MNNLEWLWEHDRGRILRNLTMEDDPCRICPKHDVTNPDVCDSGRCTEVMREWLLAEHVDDESCNQVADQREHTETPHASKWRSNDAQDSREKLEADVLVSFGDGLVRSIIMRLLERQAAITEREIEKKWSCFSDSAGGHITELTEQLESAHAKNRALKAHIAKMQEGRHGWHIKGKELQQQVDTMRDVIREFRDERDHYIELFHEQERRANELQSRDANIAREIGTLRAERDRYRELCGKLLDAADDMRRVRDVFDQFSEVD